MPTLGTLVTVVTADTKGFTAGMGDAANRAKKFEDETTSALGGVEGALGKVRQSLAGFREITELAFGFHVGRMFFEQVHDAMGKVAAGTAEAFQHGFGFAESLGIGLQHMLGMSTALDYVVAQEKQAAEFAEIQARAHERSIRSDRSQDALVRGAIKALGGEAPFDPFGKTLSGLGIREPGLQSEAERLKDKLGQTTDDLAIERQKLLENDRKKLENTTRNPKYDENKARLDTEAEEIHQRIKELLQEQVQDQQLLTNFTKEAAKKQKEIDEALRVDVLRKEMEERDAADKKSMAEILKKKAALENMPTAKDTAGFGGLQDLHNALQMAALAGKAADPPTGKEQIKQTGKMDDIDKTLKSFNAAPLIWA